MTKYEVRARIYFDNLTEASKFYEALKNLKDKAISFNRLGSTELEKSEITLIENNHDVGKPCKIIKELQMKDESVWDAEKIDVQKV